LPDGKNGSLKTFLYLVKGEEKIPIWVNFGGSCNGRCCIFYSQLVYLLPFGTQCGHLVYFMDIWYIFPILVCCTKKNLATLKVLRFIADFQNVTRQNASSKIVAIKISQSLINVP
jgi:hypothetical protein